MINFEYEDVIEYLKSGIDDYQIIKFTITKRLQEVSKYKYKSYEINKSINEIRMFHPKYELGFWSIHYDQFKVFLRQQKINKFLDYAQ